MMARARTPDHEAKANGASLGYPAALFRRNRLVLLLAVLTLLAGLGWLLGGFASVPTDLARRALRSRDLDAAGRWLQWAERLNGRPAELEMLWARLDRKQGDLQSMDRHLAAASDLGVENDLVYRERMLAAAQIGQLPPIEGALKKWLADPGDEGPEICEAYSNGLATVGRLGEAQVILNAWQADCPDDPEPHLRRGRILEHQLSDDAAEAEYRLAVEKGPSYPPALYALARQLVDRKNPEEALPLYQACGRLAPATAPAANVGEASCLRTLDQVEEARRLLQGVLARDPRECAEAYRRLGQTVEGDPAAFELGKLESIERNFAEAEKWLRRAVDKNPRDLDARFSLSVALRGLGRIEEAKREGEYVRLARRALEETDTLYDRLDDKPDDVEARYRIGIAYLKYRSERAGLYWLQSVLSYDPHHKPTHEALAEYYAARAGESEATEKLAEHHRGMAEASKAGSP